MMSLPKDFNWKIYVYLNKDIVFTSDEKNIKKNAIDHFLNFGDNEKRKYKFENVPSDFNYKNYIEINKPILKEILNHNEDNPDELHLRILQHYNTIGFHEKLLYKLEKYNAINTKNPIIIHITHNFSGGTNIYIENLKNIYNKFKHVVVNIVSENIIKIKNKHFSINSLDNILNNAIVITHHLLYLDETTSSNRINKSIINKLKNSKSKLKLLIVHDYCYFFPNYPNPIKKNKLKPEPDKVIKTKNLFSFFKYVFFNSTNCFNNYLKYLKTLENAVILNSAPDINYYNKRIFPPRKESYNIGIIGDIGCEHKGRDLAKDIIKNFNENNLKHKFIIFGNYHINLENLTITGEYNNNDIFGMIKKYDIDYFIFLSVFEETYSFTLSIALHTGLPIIYNNIGAYTERLINYNNCFPFEEREYKKIVDIFQNIKNNKSLSFENKNIPVEYPEIYNCIPEISKLIYNANVKFDIKNMYNNLNNKNICFINFVNINNGIDILTEQINYIKQSGLYDKLDYILIIALGKQIKLTFLDHKIKVVYHSNNCLKNEYPAMNFIKNISDKLDCNVKILYIHVKGVLQKPHAYEWRKYLEYFLIEKHEICLKGLNAYSCVGVNQQYYFDDENKFKNHFSGNFWWANSHYIKNLKPVIKSKDRYLYEHWLIGDLTRIDYRHLLSLHHTPHNLYEHSMLPEEYNIEVIKSNIKNTLQTKYTKNRKIYGVYFICCIGDYLNIVNEQINLLIKSDLYNLTDNIICFICNLDASRDNECINLLKTFDKITIITTHENTFEKFAINNFKKYIDITIPYYLYYMHSKSVSRNEKCYKDWRDLCDYFTITKWRLSVELLNYYDCVGINLKNFPKKHYSGNYWWSKSEHINKLNDINEGYLSPEMYICSELKTNQVSIFQSNVTHGDTNFDSHLYIKINNDKLISNTCILPDFNEGDKKTIEMCGTINDGLYYSS
jgi:hypothetical protein